MGGEGGEEMKRKCHGSITENKVKHRFHFVEKPKWEICLEQLVCAKACLTWPLKAQVLLHNA